MTGRADLEAALGPALARALDVCGLDEPKQSDWLILFVEAVTLSHDKRIHDAAVVLEASVRRGWPSVERAGEQGFVASVMRSIDACLRAADLHGDDARTRLAIVDAVDELERVVGPRYRPGAGLTGGMDNVDDLRGDLRDCASAASALLSAYERTGRLPYSMLAEELMQFAIRLKPDPTDVIASCEAVSVLCRIAALHEDAEYREAAVIAPDTDYAADAERLLVSLADRFHARGAAVAAEYGLALADWLALQPNLQ